MAEERKTNAPHGWPERFIRAYAKCGSVRKAAAAAKVDRSTVYSRRKSDPEFAEAMDLAQEDAADLLEEEAIRRAKDGVVKAVYYQGTEIGQVREYSDSLIALLLKGVKPEKYRERTDVTSAGQAVKGYIGFDTDAV